MLLFPTVLLLFYGIFHATIFTVFANIGSCKKLYLIFPADYIYLCSHTDMMFGAVLWTFFSLGVFVTLLAGLVMQNRGHSYFKSESDLCFSYKLVLMFAAAACISHFLSFFFSYGGSIRNVILLFVIPISLSCVIVKTKLDFVKNTALIAGTVIFSVGKLPLILIGFKLLAFQTYSSQKFNFRQILIFPILFFLIIFAISEARLFLRASIPVKHTTKVEALFVRPLQRLLLFEPTIYTKRLVDNGYVEFGEGLFAAQRAAKKDNGLAIGMPNHFAVKYGPALGGVFGGLTVGTLGLIVLCFARLCFLSSASLVLVGTAMLLMTLDFGKTALFFTFSVFGVGLLMQFFSLYNNLKNKRPASE